VRATAVALHRSPPPTGTATGKQSFRSNLCTKANVHLAATQYINTKTQDHRQAGLVYTIIKSISIPHAHHEVKLCRNMHVTDIQKLRTDLPQFPFLFSSRERAEGDLSPRSRDRRAARKKMPQSPLQRPLQRPFWYYVLTVSRYLSRKAYSVADMLVAVSEHVSADGGDVGEDEEDRGVYI
jgi:hypothetical protein